MADNPFRAVGDPDATSFVRPRPRPGGRPPSPSAEPSGSFPPPPAFAEPGPMPEVAGDGPLLAAARPLLSLVARIGGEARPRDLDALWDEVAAALAGYPDAACRHGASTERAGQAAWGLAALFDDIVRNQPWAQTSVWRQRSLVGHFYQQQDAGEAFFEHLASMSRQPAAHTELLELWYLCLALGFRGKYRSQNPAALAQEQKALHRLLQELRPGRTPLAPHWPGVRPPQRPPATIVPPWAVACVVATLILVILISTGRAIGIRADALDARANQALPAAPVPVVHDQPTARPVEPIIRHPVQPQLARCLDPAVRAGQVELNETPQRLLIRLHGNGRTPMFDSGGTDLRDPFPALVRCVAQDLRGRAGTIRVIGYTDSSPVSRTNRRFDSNRSLSAERALTVAGLLRQGLNEPQRRVEVTGKGELDLILDAGGREDADRSRRVEILLLKAG